MKEQVKHIRKIAFCIKNAICSLWCNNKKSEIELNDTIHATCSECDIRHLCSEKCNRISDLINK